MQQNSNLVAQFQKAFADKSEKLRDNGRFLCEWDDVHPCLNDNLRDAPFDPHYVYHTAWAARVLEKVHPDVHVDIASCIRFVSLVSAFIPIKFYDYRRAGLRLPGVFCGEEDVTRLTFADASIMSLSCMHVVEHIGLERYGDAFDPQGDIKAIGELQRVLAPGGMLLFVVPVGGVARIQYNAHRIYTHRQVIDFFHDFELIEYALVTDSGFFVQHATEAQSNGQRYGCGCFCFRRKA